MATNLTDTGFNFSDGTTQTTKFDATMDNGYLLSIQTFTGSGTWTKPAGCEKVLVKVVGGGGGAAGYCESGGGGGYAEKTIMVDSVSTVSVTVGGGGNSVGYYTSASDGGTSSFGSYVSASGGYGANRNYSHTGGHGGVGYKGDLNLHGGDGTGHTNHGGHFPAGNGGGTYFGGSACVSRATTSTKLSNGAPGTGGPGGRTNDGGSGSGQAYGENGIVIVYNYAGAPGKLGSTSALAASSAAAIKAAHPESSDGVYWINLPTAGATQVFCLMDNIWDGGGWMMMMKATRANTFSWGSGYWTGVNTLNPGNQNRDDGDMKNNVMNYFAAKDIMGIWPDLGNGGMITGRSQGTIWLENNYYGGNRIVPITFFNGTVSNYNPNGRAVRNAMWNGGSQFSSQSGAQWYGFNFTANGSNQVRWGFAWNNEGDWGSNDVSGGIGMNRTGYSAGDYIGCCQDVTGFNRSARIELYVR